MFKLKKALPKKTPMERGIDALASAKPLLTALGSVVGLVAASASLSALRERRERSGDEAEGGSQ